MEEKLKSLYDNIKGNYELPDYDTFKADMSDPLKSQKLHSTLTEDNYDVPDYDTFTNDLGLKKKASPLDLASTGQTVLQELGQPSNEPITPKLPFQQEKVKKEKPTYETTLPQDLTLNSIGSADKSRADFINNEAEKIEKDGIDRIKEEFKQLSGTFTGDELEAEKNKLIDLRTAEIQKAIDNKYKDANYKFIKDDVKDLSSQIEQILNSGIDHAEKDAKINAIRESVVSQIPQEAQAQVNGEINKLISDVSSSTPLGEQFILKKTTSDALTKLKDAQSKIREEYLSKFKYPETSPMGGGFIWDSKEQMDAFLKFRDDDQKLAVAQKYLQRALNVPESKEGAGKKAFKNELDNILTAGLSGMVESIVTAQGASQQAKGVKNEANDAILNAYGLLQTVNQIASEGIPRFRRATSIAGSLPYMEQFLLTGGIGTGASATATNVGKAMMAKGIKNRLAQGVVKRVVTPVIEGTISMIGRVPLSPATYGNIAKESIGDLKVEDGKFVVDPTKMPKISDAIATGTYNSAKEIFSESLGGMIDFKLPKILNRAITPNVKKFFKMAGMNNPFGEYYEEMVSQALGGENPVDPEFLKDLVFTIPAMTGGFAILTVPSIGREMRLRANAKDVIDKFGKDNISDLRDLIEMGEESAVVLKLQGLAQNAEITQKDLSNLLKYSGSLVQENTIKEMEAPVTTDKGTAVTEIGALNVPPVLEDKEVVEAPFKIGDQAFATKEELNTWLDENYTPQSLSRVDDANTEQAIGEWEKANKDVVMQRGLDAETKLAEDNQRKRVVGLENAEYKGIVDYGEGARDSYDVTTPSGVVTNMLLPHGAKIEKVQQAVNDKRDSFKPKTEESSLLQETKPTIESTESIPLESEKDNISTGDTKELLANKLRDIKSVWENEGDVPLSDEVTTKISNELKLEKESEYKESVSDDKIRQQLKDFESNPNKNTIETGIDSFGYNIWFSVSKGKKKGTYNITDNYPEGNGFYQSQKSISDANESGVIKFIQDRMNAHANRGSFTMNPEMVAEKYFNDKENRRDSQLVKEVDALLKESPTKDQSTLSGKPLVTDKKVEEVQSENPIESSLEVKEPILAPIAEKNTEVPPEPPSAVKTAENASRGDKKTREIGAKVIDSANVSQEVKDALLENGIDYIPRGKKITQTEAKEIVDAFSTNEDGLDKLAQTVYDIKNDIAGDTRVTLNVYIAEKYSKLLDEATDTKTREKYRNKVAEAFIFGQEFATSAGQTVEAMKRWRELLSRDPESLIAIKKRQQRKTNDFVLQGMESDIKSAKELLDSVVNTDEFKQFVETEVNKEIDKIANKKYGEVDKKKINDFFDSLIIKNDKAFDATIGIPIAVYNGAMLTIKKAVLAGVDIANAIKQAVDYIDNWYKENYAKGTTPSPEWNKDDYVAQMNTLLKPLTKKVKKVKMKVSKKVEDSLVDKIYAKMSNATKPQLRRLVREYISTLESEGVINEQRFKDLFAQAIGLDVLTAENEQKIRETALSLKNATKTAERLVEKFKELVNETDNAKIKQLEEEIKSLKKEANKAKFEAQKAAKKLSDLMADKATLGTTIHTLIQGNLLTPISLVSNVVGNTMFLPVRNVSYMVSSGLDLMISKLSSLYTPLLGDPWVKANPRLRRLIESLPTPSREYDYFASTRGYWYGVPVGLQEGISQVWTGTLPEDQYQQYIGQGLNPWKAALRARDQMTGKEQMGFDTFLANLLEAFPTTYMAEGFFRALNLGDKPYRRAAERSRLEELATLKGLKGTQRESFLNNPDPDSVEEARKEGDVAVYQQDTIVSEMFSYLNKKINRVVSKDGAKRTSVIISTVGALLKATQAPYIKTPVNLIGEAIDYSIPALSMFRALYYAKEGNKRKSYEYFGKAAVGYMLMNVAFFLIKEGLLTPPTDDDEKIRQAQYNAKPGYSLNLDALWRKISKDDATWKDKDQVMNIQRLGVFSMILMGMSKAYAEFPPDEMEKEMSFMEKSSYSLRMIPAEVGASLEQSFLSGTASGIKAFTEGGPAFDKWVISTSKALSAVVYPNTLAQISQVFFDDNYIREVRDMYSRDDKFKKQITNTFKDRTFMGKDLPAKVTLWGERVNRVPEGESWAHVMFDVTKSVEYQKSSFGVRMFEWYERMKFLDETEAKKILPSIPSGSNTVGWDDRNMTAKEVEEFQMMVGQRRKSYVENMMNSEEWALLSDEDKILELEKVYRNTASKVKAGMFMLDVIKADKKVFKFLEENDMIPVPSKAVVLNYQRKKVKLTPEETLEYYQNVQRHFVERINNTNLLEDKVERDEKAQERLLKQINGHWDKSKEAAERYWKAEQNKQ